MKIILFVFFFCLYSSFQGRFRNFFRVGGVKTKIMFFSCERGRIVLLNLNS